MRIVDAKAHRGIDILRAGDAFCTASSASLISIATVRHTSRPG